MSSVRRRRNDSFKKRKRPRNREHHLVVAVAVTFSLTLLSFVASRAIGESVSRKIEREARSISRNALIATESLVTVRSNLHKLAFDMNGLDRHHDPSRVAGQVDVLDHACREATAFWTRYVSIPFYPGERPIAENVGVDVSRARLAADDVSERLRRGDREAALRIVDQRALPSIEHAYQGIERLIQFNAREAQSAATRILASRRPWGLVPELMGLVFGAAAAYFGVRLLIQYLAWAADRSRELELFAGRVAHDIRSPLGSATLAVELAQGGKDVDPKTRELLERARRTMQRIDKLVDGLLVFAASGGYIVPAGGREERTSAAEILDGVVEDATLEASAKAIELDYEEPDPSIAVACNAGVLISMTTNLLSNAMKFMGDAAVRRITIRVRRLDDDIEVSVGDTGPGIDAQLRTRIFQPHVRGTSKVAGFGLGLATVQRLAEAHGGTVGVDSIAEGGSRFWFRLPVCIDEPRRGRHAR
jgi:signal transduction histidine kinase